MRVLLKTLLAGPNGVRSPGEHEVSNEEGAALCAAGYATPLHASEVERAVVAPVEQAVIEPRDNPPRKRKGR